MARVLLIHGLLNRRVNGRDDFSDAFNFLEENGVEMLCPEINYLKDRQSPLEELANEVGSPFMQNPMPQNQAVAAHSFGSLLALNLGSYFSDIVLIAPYIKIPTGEQPSRTDSNKELRRLFYEPDKLNPEVASHYWNVWTDYTSKENMRKLVKLKNKATKAYFEGLYSKVHEKVILVCGEGDTISPTAYLKELSVRIPPKAMYIARGCRHMPHLEQPEIIKKAASSLVYGNPKQLAA